MAALTHDDLPASKLRELEYKSVTKQPTRPRRRQPVVRRRKAWLPPNLEGVIFNERYRMGGLLGVGGTALIYKAEHIEIQKPVAVKILHPRYANNSLDADRFLEEARAASRLGHEHIINITDCGRTPDGFVYFVLEYLAGEDLETTLRVDGPLLWLRVVRIAKQICAALTLAHESGIIHRDIKPANCFRITRNNNADFIKVLDFGIATSLRNPRTRDDASAVEQMGTPAYMAPELLIGAHYDHRVDIYALGVLMYRLLTRELPVPQQQAIEAQRSSASLVKMPRELDIPEAIEQIILRAMRHDPARRFRDAKEFHYALEQVEADLSDERAANLLQNDPLRWRGEPGQRAALAPAQIAEAAHSVTEASQSYIVMPLSSVTDSLTAHLGATGGRYLLNPTLTAFVIVTLLGLFMMFASQAYETKSSGRDAYTGSGARTTPIRHTNNTRAPAPRAPGTPSVAPLRAPAALKTSTPPAITTGASATTPTSAQDESPPTQRQRATKSQRGLSRRAFVEAFKDPATHAWSDCKKFTGGMQSTLDVRVTVARSGAIAHLSLGSSPPRLGSCVKDALETLKFPASPRRSTHRWRMGQERS